MTPSYYTLPEGISACKDLTDLFVLRYGPQAVVLHLLMELEQYSWRCLAKGDTEGDMAKIATISQRIRQLQHQCDALPAFSCTGAVLDEEEMVEHLRLQGYSVYKVEEAEATPLTGTDAPGISLLAEHPCDLCGELSAKRVYPLGVSKAMVCPHCLDLLTPRLYYTDNPSAGFSLRQYLDTQREWSAQTFGPGERTNGIVAHIKKELGEIETAATPEERLREWVDVLILGLDGAWRTGAPTQAILDALAQKAIINRERTWPDWRTLTEDQPIEHVREEKAPVCTFCDGRGFFDFGAGDCRDCDACQSGSNGNQGDTDAVAYQRAAHNGDETPTVTTTATPKPSSENPRTILEVARDYYRARHGVQWDEVVERAFITTMTGHSWPVALSYDDHKVALSRNPDTACAPPPVEE